MSHKKVALIIMDGWGKGSNSKGNAVAQANTPFIDYLYKNYPHTELLTHGENVGLPFGQMGNSEVGHLNIGSGRVVYQELLKINNAVENGELKENVELNSLFEYCLKNEKPLHLMGLVSDGGVHSHLNHVKAICDLAKEYGLGKNQVFIHAFTDGRDTDPKGGLGFIKELQNHLLNSVGQIVTLCGRYYAMDRDKRWERVKIAYDLLTKNTGKKSTNLLQSIEDSYAANITDEFLNPIVHTDKNGTPFAQISEGDAVLCFNFRTDRCREITEILTQSDMPEFSMKRLSLYYVTLTVYDSNFKNIHTIFSNDKLKNTLGEVLFENGKSQLRAAETEKYPHVTFFFSGGKEELFEQKNRIMEPSPKVATYDLQPEMSAHALAKKVVSFIHEKQPDFICLNFANADMVGHTGVFNAVVKAVETVNNSVEQVVKAALAHDYAILLTADHGNADFMQNEDGTPNTAHTKNPVPLFLIDNDFKPSLHAGKLADIAPTVLKLMSIVQPKEMTGNVLY